MAKLLDKRLVVVTGKGGVGKTTVAAALGLLAARAGKRTIVAEVSEQEHLPALFGRSGAGHREVEISPGLYGLSIDPARAKEEWLRHQLRSSTLAGMLGNSRIFQYLTAAAPGVDELVTIGRIWDMAQLERHVGGTRTYDLAIVDAPATGHGVALLRAPRTYAAIARVGPIARQAGRIHEFIADHARTGVVAVALPEEMPVNETIDLGERLRAEMGMALDAILVNAVYPERFDTAEAKRLAAVNGRGPAAVRPALESALSELRRVRGQRAEVARLRRAADAPVRTLPFLFEPELGAAEVDRLSRELERRL